MGVNLPAHLVIVKSTQHYVMGSYQEYSESQVLQMIGRAGRPQVRQNLATVPRFGIDNYVLLLVLVRQDSNCGDHDSQFDEKQVRVPLEWNAVDREQVRACSFRIRIESSIKYSEECCVCFSLHTHLVEHLNAEIVLGTINDYSVALDWLKSTFLYVRVMRNPKHYNIRCGSRKEDIERKLQG